MQARSATSASPSPDPRAPGSGPTRLGLARGMAQPRIHTSYPCLHPCRDAGSEAHLHQGCVGWAKRSVSPSGGEGRCTRTVPHFRATGVALPILHRPEATDTHHGRDLRCRQASRPDLPRRRRTYPAGIRPATRRPCRHTRSPGLWRPCHRTWLGHTSPRIPDQ